MRPWSLRPIAILACVAAAAGLARAQERPLAAAGLPEVLVSRQLLEVARVAVGGPITLSTDESGADARIFRVVGVFEPTPDPFRINSRRLEVRLHLPDLIGMTADPADPEAAERITAFNLTLVDGEDPGEYARMLDRRVPGINARRTVRPMSTTEPFVVIERFHVAISIVTLAGATMFLLALMVMHVDERRATAGVLRVLGVPARRVLLHVFIEGVLIALAGVAFGVVLAAASQGGFNRFFQWRYDTALVFVRITPGVIWRSIVYAVPLGLLAAVASAWLLLRRDALSLFRR